MDKSIIFSSRETLDGADSDSSGDFPLNCNLSNSLGGSPPSDMEGLYTAPILTRLSTAQVKGHVALAGSSFSFARVSSTSNVSDAGSPSGSSPKSTSGSSPKSSSLAQIQLNDESDGSNIQILQQIGSGSFGRVFLGLLGSEKVAVKAMFEERRRSSTGVTPERKDMENRKNKMLKLEGLLMRLVSGHPNIVRTIKCLSTDP